MDQYLLIPFLGGWTSIYQLFWCSPGVQGFDTLPFVYLYICNMQHAAPGVHVVEDFISQSEADELLRQVDLKPWNTSDLAKRGFFSRRAAPRESQGRMGYHELGMGQYLLIPLLVEWTSIYQLFWGSLGTRVLTHPQLAFWWGWYFFNCVSGDFVMTLSRSWVGLWCHFVFGDSDL